MSGFVIVSSRKPDVYVLLVRLELLEIFSPTHVFTLCMNLTGWQQALLEPADRLSWFTYPPRVNPYSDRSASIGLALTVLNDCAVIVRTDAIRTTEAATK